MTQITIYPRLYTTHFAGGQGVLVSKGDAMVESLYEAFVNRTINPDSCVFHETVLQTALRLFGNFDQWLRDQRDNPYLLGHNAEFLKDTLNYIETGRRLMSVQNWIELVSEGSDATRMVEPTHYSPYRLSPNGQSTAHVLQSWCSHPEGFEDLVNTLHLLFGHARNPNS